MVLAAIPDEWQNDRIKMLLTSDQNTAFGLLRAGDTCVYTRDHHHYAEKILELMKTLKKVRSVSNWMAENRVFQDWMEFHQRKIQGHSDSDSDDDSDCDDNDDNALVKEMMVEGAGLREINGVYVRVGKHDHVSKFVRTSRYNGRLVDLLLFRCKLTDGTRRWYISIVPENANPGTTQDIDFYAVPVYSEQHDSNIPQRDDWITIPSNGGGGPAPQVYPLNRSTVSV